MKSEQIYRLLAHIPIYLLFILFTFSPPLAVVLFVLRYIAKEKEKQDKEINQQNHQSSFSNQTYNYNYNYNYSTSGHSTSTSTWRQRQASGSPYVDRTPSSSPYPYPPSSSDTSTQSSPSGEVLDHPTKDQKNAKDQQQLLISACTIAGAVLLLFGGINLFNSFETLSSSGFLGFLGDFFPALGMMIGGGGGLFAGLHIQKNRRLEKQLDRIVGDKDNIKLDELFSIAKIDSVQGHKLLEDAIEHGYFGADAYIDYRTDTLVVRGNAPTPPPTSQPQEEEVSPRFNETEYEKLLRQLREVNDRIPDAVMTQKISRLEHVSERIFLLAEQNPAKRPQLQKFINYYLPTALRLLDTYAKLPQRSMEGENISETRRSIEQSMDMLVSAFENQLDKLYQTDALDVSTDIAALQGMLNLDGLTGQNDFDLNKN